MIVVGVFLTLWTSSHVPECLAGSSPAPLLRPGSVYVTPWIEPPAPRCLQKRGPQHSIYAMSETTFFNIAPFMDIHTTIPTILHVNDFEAVKKWVRPHRRHKTIKKETAIALANRMAGMVYPYRLHRCNCRHYVDYLMYGRTFGRAWDITYMTISDDCPLHGELTSDTDVNSPSFKLYDKHGNPYDLGDPRTSPTTRSPTSYHKLCPSVRYSPPSTPSDYTWSSRILSRKYSESDEDTVIG